MPDPGSAFGRILLKMSGEALTGQQNYGIDPAFLEHAASEIESVHSAGTQIAIVIGGGNIFRGLQSAAYGMDRVAGDDMGMLATVINAIALGEALRQKDMETVCMSSLGGSSLVEPYERRKALEHLSKNRIVLMGGGTGSPYFTTDTAAALRALEIKADALFKATKVDGVFDADPVRDTSARLFKKLRYDDVLEKNLKVMDRTAVSLAMEGVLPIVVFNLGIKGNLKRAVFEKDIGTLITGDIP